MDDGLRVSVDSRTVTIYQNAGDPDYPADEISISMTLDAFQKVVAISRVALGVKAAPKRETKTEQTEHFNEFWSAYPKKVSKDAALRAWCSVSADDHHQEILTALDAMLSSEGWVKDGGKFIPHASTWLNGRRWLDVVEAETDLGIIK
jgi:hypothetical protein